MSKMNSKFQLQCYFALQPFGDLKRQIRAKIKIKTMKEKLPRFPQHKGLPFQRF